MNLGHPYDTSKRHVKVYRLCTWFLLALCVCEVDHTIALEHTRQAAACLHTPSRRASEPAGRLGLLLLRQPIEVPIANMEQSIKNVFGDIQDTQGLPNLGIGRAIFVL